MTDSKTLTICYTDIKDSTKLNIALGNEEMKRLKDEHFRIAEELIIHNSGKTVKKLGDGLLCHFNNPSDALRFSSELQEIEKIHPGLDCHYFDIKIGLSHGEVTLDDDDIDGIAANFGSRVQSVANPGQILLDEGSFKALKSQWSQDKVCYLCSNIEEKHLKGFGDELLWNFDWKKFNNEEYLIAKLVYNQLTIAEFELTNAEREILYNGGRIFWPVVSRNIATAIHKGQLEAIKLLSFCGWTTHLFIADSNQLFESANYNNSRFKDKIEEYAKNLGVSIMQVEYLSDIFNIKFEEFQNVLSIFKEVTNNIFVKDIYEYETKSYKNKDKYVMEKNLLEFLRPVFTIVAFLRFARKHPQDQILVIAGRDERRQWKNLLSMESTRGKTSIIFNSELKKGKHLMRQTQEWPSWNSKQECEEQMNGTNLSEWLFNHFILLSAFPSSRGRIGKLEYTKEEWKEKISKDITKRSELINEIWEKIRKIG